jgi:glycosyltransferase involved in cell wall biosynthesis
MRLNMNILVVQETDWIQNLPLQTHHIMEYLSKKGHTVRVVDYEARWQHGDILQSTKSKTIPNVHRTDSESSVSLLRPGMLRVPGIGRLSSLGSQFRVIFEQMARWCDVVVLYSVPTNGVQAILSSKLLSKPVVFHAFDVLHRMTGYNLLRAPTWTLERFVYQRVNKMIVISASLGKYMRQIGVHAEDITLLPPAVDTRKFNPSVEGSTSRKQLGIRIDEKVILFSGFLYEFSGVDLVLRSIKDMREVVPNVRLVICGEGPLQNKLTQMRREQGVENYVSILGRRPFEQMPSIVAAADVCINPYLEDVRSTFAFPSKIAEYMAAGKPVVATDLPGTESILGSGSGAILVPVEQFVDSLKTVLKDDEQRRTLGAKCREYSEAMFSIESVSKRFENVLSEAIISQGPT